MTDDATRDTARLRERAEARLRLTRTVSTDLPPEELCRLVHELQVHQVELQMQNEDLLVTQAELAQSRDRYNDLYDFAPVGYLTLDASGRIVEANLTLSRMLDVERRQLVGAPFARFISQETQDAFHLHREAVAGSEYKQSRELVLRRGTGTLFPVLLESIRVCGLHGEGPSCQSVIIDITARKAAETEMDRMRDLLAEGQRIGHVGSWEYITATHETVWSDEQKRIYGLDPGAPSPVYEDMLRRHIHPDDAADLNQAFLEALRNGAVFENKNRVVWPDGTVRWIYNKAWPFFDTDGALVRYIGSTLDITDRVQTEQALRRAHHDLERAQQVGQIGSWRLDLRRNILTWSDENHRIFGVPRGTSMSYEGFLAIVHPDDRDYVDTQWRAALQGGAYDIEHRILVEGQVKWVREKAFLEFDANGALHSGIGITQDITDRKRIELEHLRLASVVERSPDFIGISDLSGRPGFLNQGGRRMVGLGGDFDVGLTEIRDYFVREERNFVDRVVLPAALNQGRWSGDLTFRHWLTEAPIPVLYDVFRIDDPQTGKPLYFATVTRDMTEMKRGESALRASEALFRAVYEHAAIGIAIGDPEGHLLECNPAFQALLGYDSDELNQLISSELVHPDDRAANLAQMRRLVAKELPFFETESRYLRKDGRAVWVHKFVSLLCDSAGKPTHLVALVTDITVRRELEEALRDADRRKDEFLAMLAHELRNPLTPIRNGLSVLRMTGDSSPVTQSLVAMMERQMVHVVRLVDDLMDVSRITQGKIGLQTERVDLAGVVDEVIAATRSSIDAVQHTLDVSLPPEPVWVVADRVRVAQVLDNLLNNAVKYMDPGGYIRVTVERRDAEAVVTVRDHGIGIAPDMLPHVFDLFTQSNHGSAKALGGLGLGLALVRRLIEMQGGRVGVVSGGLGQGSEFSFCLPLAPASGDSAVQETALTALRFPRRVLIVDDNRDVADSLALSVELLGIAVHVEYGGPAALNALDAFAPEVVLMDLGMPGMDGFEVAHEIRQHPHGRSVHLIALTGWGQEQDQRRSREAGFDHHLVKPVDLDLLESVLGSLSVREEDSA